MAEGPTSGPRLTLPQNRGFLCSMVDPVTGALVTTAETAGKAIDAARDAGGFVAKVLGTVPEDAVGLLGGDYLHHLRLRNIDRLERDTEKILESRGIQDTITVSPSLAIPLLHAAAYEGRSELQELWARLLANAMDPNRGEDLRIEFIEALKRFHPLDALVVREIAEAPMGQVDRQLLSVKLDRSGEAIAVSFRNLEKLEVVVRLGGMGDTIRTLTSFGSELYRACSP